MLTINSNEFFAMLPHAPHKVIATIVCYKRQFIDKIFRLHLARARICAIKSPKPRRGPRTLWFSAIPPKNSVEGDGPEGCGANPSHREGAEVKREVTGSCRERGCDSY